MRKKVLVTGGAGFIGHHLVKRLVDLGYDVTVVDNLATGKRANIPAGVHFLESCVSMLPPKVQKLDFYEIYHLASPASPKRYQQLPEETYRANVTGTEFLGRMAAVTGTKLLFASTSEVYGEPYHHPQAEESWGKVMTLGPRAIYEQSKRMGESLCGLWQSRGAKITIARIFNTYGPGMDEDDGRVMINFIRQARDNKPFTVYGTGRQTRSFCYVDDTVEALLTLMDRGESGVYNVGNPREVSVIELARLIDS